MINLFSFWKPGLNITYVSVKIGRVYIGPRIIFHLGVLPP